MIDDLNIDCAIGPVGHRSDVDSLIQRSPGKSRTTPADGTGAHCDRYTAAMDARPLLAEVGRRLREAGLEAVLIGNAATALQGAPVTTIDFDFFFRRTPRS